MHLGEPANRKTKRIVWAILGGFTILFIATYWREIVWLFGRPPAIMQSGDVLGGFDFVLYNCFFGFLFVFVFWIVLIAFQALLPITNIFENPLRCLLEVYRTCWHLFFHMIRKHGPAIFVKDGTANTTSEDTKHEGPGVVVVDYNSAIVLEERNLPPGIPGAFRKIFLLILEMFLIIDRKVSPRVCGPGITFTRPRERIRGAVDLRKQFRMQPKVRCYTREGIELYANVLAIFTIGQEPDILQVAYTGDGEPCPEQLRVVNLEKKPGGFQRITLFSDELDEEDRKEIHRFFIANPQQTTDRPVFEPYAPPQNTSDLHFNSDRVFSAVYAQARNGQQEVLPWTELPTRVASGLYREQLLQVNYDELYDVREEHAHFPLSEYKRKLRLAMRNNGILAFRFVAHRAGTPLIRGRIYPESDLTVTQPRLLTNPKVLRDRGIKVLFSSFGDLVPVNEAVYKQRLDAWRSTWQKELEINLAEHDLEAMRVRSRAYGQAQEDLWRSLRQIFDERDYTDEALALRILQALDQAASDPKTRALLPANTIDMLRYVQSLMLPMNNRPVIEPPRRGLGQP